jgi:acyl-CoA synthetase (AMP-forming)/AMP-acid ligase II
MGENIAGLLRAAAERSPDAPALHMARTGESVSFAALWASAGRVAAGLRARGIGPGDRVLLMVEPGPDFVAATFGVLQLGAVAVFMDPGLGRRHFLRCLASVAPKGMIAVRLLHALRAARPAAFRSVSVAVSVGPWPGAVSLRRLMEGDCLEEVVPRAPSETALIAFTSGSTGEPKGVAFSQRALQAQVRTFRSLFDVSPKDVCLAVFPMLAVLGPSLGCTTVLPEFHRRGPAALDPARLAAAILRYGVTHTFGSPAAWDGLGKFCVQHDITLPSLRCLLMGGAPVSLAILERFSGRLAPGAEPCAPYGATEAVPITNVGLGEIRAEHARATSPRGILLGRPVPGLEVCILPISDRPLDAPVPVPAGEVGEIAVRGEIVSSAYFGRPDADALAKVPDAGGPWHRMGDLGFVDGDGRLWFCGRKSERIETAQGSLYTACVEPLFATDPRVRRAAVVGVGPRPRQQAVLVVEPEGSSWPRSRSARGRFVQELLAIGTRAPGGYAIGEVLFHPSLPVDIRHNAKILRAELARWATEQLS